MINSQCCPQNGHKIVSEISIVQKINKHFQKKKRLQFARKPE